VTPPAPTICHACGGDQTITVTEARDVTWGGSRTGEIPFMCTIRDQFSRCSICRTEWYDAGQGTQRSLAILHELYQEWQRLAALGAAQSADVVQGNRVAWNTTFLLSALHLYGQHHSWCKWFTSPLAGCDCEFVKTVIAAKAAFAAIVAAPSADRL